MTNRPRTPHSPETKYDAILVAAGMAIGLLGQQWSLRQLADFMLDRSVTIVVSSDEPGPIRLAAEDLASDFEKVLGTRPKIVTRMEDAGPQTIVVGELDQLSPGDAAQGLERARIVFDRR